MSTVSPGTEDYTVPVARRLAVGPLEWASSPTRLYGVDQIGQVFVIRTPVLAARHVSPRRPGHFARAVLRSLVRSRAAHR